jgi:hypothetical protein
MTNEKDIDIGETNMLGIDPKNLIMGVISKRRIFVTKELSFNSIKLSFMHKSFSANKVLSV